MPPLLTLAIETSNPAHAAEIALLDRSAPIAHAQLPTAARHDDALVPAIANLLHAHGSTPNDLATIAVSVGPGGFSAVRIACAAAATLALATGATLIPVPTLLALAHAAGQDRPQAPAHLIAIATKRDTASTLRTNPARPPTDQPAPTLLSLNDIAAALSPSPPTSAAPPTLITDDQTAAAIASLAPTPVEAHPPRFAALAVAAVAKHLSPTTPANLRPIYPREPEAVTNWRERKRT